MTDASPTNDHSSSLDPWALLDALPDQVVAVDRSGRIQYHNVAWREFAASHQLEDQFALDSAYADGFRAAIALREADADALAVGLFAILEGDLPSFNLDCPCRAASQERWQMISIAPWSGQHGGGALIQHRDITERWRDEQALRQAEAIFLVMPDLIFRLSRAGEYLDCKMSVENQLYVPPEQIIGKRLHDLLPTAVADEWLASIGSAIDTGQTQSYEYRMPTPRGERDFEARLVMSGVGEVLTIVRDITGRKQAEEAMRQSADQQQIIRLQEAALRELSTPLIPLSDQVVVMPLVGAVDTRRAAQVIETLLHGVEATRARVAILDITGVPLVDTQVANALLMAAQAVRLLGAQVVITGIRPEVSQTLVGLGVDLSALATRASLQDAIIYAMRR